MRDEISRHFEQVQSDLWQLEKVYNPKQSNLHFHELTGTDAALYAKLLLLAQKGLEIVRRNRKHFSQFPLYDDGMFWYHLFLLLNAASCAVIGQPERKKDVPPEIIRELIEILIDISEFSTVHDGDIVKRNHEALCNTLYAFYSPELAELARTRAKAIGSEKAQRFVKWTT